MNLSKNRLAAFGAAGALAAGSVLAGGVISPAAAGSDTAQYTCILAGSPTPLSITGTMDVPASSVSPGESMTGVPTSMGVALPGTITTLLTTLGISSADGSVTGAEFPIGNTGKSFTSGSSTWRRSTNQPHVFQHSAHHRPRESTGPDRRHSARPPRPCQRT